LLRQDAASYAALVDPAFWTGGFVALAMVNRAAWRRGDAHQALPWSLAFVPAVLGLYLLGWLLSFLESTDPPSVAWLAMIAVAVIGIVPSGMAAARSHGSARVLAALNASVLAALVTRVIVFLNGIELM